MNINITGHHIEVTPAIHDYVVNKLDRVIRHFDHVTSVHVILSVEKLVQKAEITLHLKGKHIYVVDGEDQGVTAADLAYLDAEWEDVGRCFGMDPYSHGATVFIDPVRDVRGGWQLIDCYDSGMSGDGLCYGWSFSESWVAHLPPDLKAWRHEAAEMWSYRKWGVYKAHGSNRLCGM